MSLPAKYHLRRIKMKKLGILLSFCLILGLAFQIIGEEFTNNDKWFSYDDKGDGGTSQISMSAGPGTIGGTQYNTVVSVTGKVTTSFQYGYIGFGYKPEGEDMTRLKNASGVKFKVIGDGKSYRFRGETTVVRDYDYHGKVFSTKNGQVVEVNVPFSSLRQEGWGTARGGFKKDKLWQISFQTVGQPHSSISLKVFDFELIP
jgi:hypothetical protein